MLELIRQWLVGITCAAMVVALAEGLTPPGTIRKIGKLTGGPTTRIIQPTRAEIQRMNGMAGR